MITLSSRIFQVYHVAITSKDVAAKARVSPITVSRVFNPRPEFPIAAATKERVHAAARELGYRPNRLARALVTGRTHVVTLHVPELSAYYAQIVCATQRLLMEDHYEMIMLIDPFRVGEPGAPVPDRRPFPCDGILAVDMPGRMDTLRQTDGHKDTPLVTMGTHPPENADYVVIDLHAGAKEALRHLIDSGARSIGYVVWDFLSGPGDARRDAYELVMREAGLPTRYYPLSWPSREAASRELGSLLVPGDLPDALFCYNDDLAIGAYYVLREMGVRVPDDIQLCGCDGVPDTKYLAVPLTTISQPVEEMCRRAWRILRARIGDPSLPPQQEILLPHLLVRESTCRSKPFTSMDAAADQPE